MNLRSGFRQLGPRIGGNPRVILSSCRRGSKEDDLRSEANGQAGGRTLLLRDGG